MRQHSGDLFIRQVICLCHEWLNRSAVIQQRDDVVVHPASLADNQKLWRLTNLSHLSPQVQEEEMIFPRLDRTKDSKHRTLLENRLQRFWYVVTND